AYGFDRTGAGEIPLPGSPQSISCTAPGPEPDRSPPAPVTASIAGPTVGVVDQTVVFTGTVGSNLSSLAGAAIYWAPTISSGRQDTWASSGETWLSDNSATFRGRVRFPQPGEYWVMVSAWDVYRHSCTGNPSYYGTDAFPINMAPCGPNASLVVTITAA